MKKGTPITYQHIGWTVIVLSICFVVWGAVNYYLVGNQNWFNNAFEGAKCEHSILVLKKEGNGWGWMCRDTIVEP